MKKEKTKLVVCGTRQIYELICRVKGWNPNDRNTVYCYDVERMVGRNPDDVIVVWGHDAYRSRDGVCERAEMLEKMGAERMWVQT